MLIRKRNSTESTNDIPMLIYTEVDDRYVSMILLTKGYESKICLNFVSKLVLISSSLISSRLGLQNPKKSENEL